MKRFSNRSGFTLLELLIVIGILAVLATAAVLVINPVEYLKQSRDSKRISDLVALNKALQLYVAEQSNSALLGTSTIVYVSLPDTASSTCGSYVLPALSAPWQYHCASSVNLKNTNGTGWLPVNLSSLAIGSPLGSLPVDPTNAVNGFAYYTYTTNGGFWEIDAQMEGARDMLGGVTDRVSTDGGDDFTRYETGNSLTVAPWNFEFNTFLPAANNSGLPGWYQYVGGATLSFNSDSQASNYLSALGTSWDIWQENIPFDPNATYKMECRMRQSTDPTVGGKSTYCGWTGVGSDGITLVNISGTNNYGSQHYHAAAGTLMSVGTWTTYTGYTRGQAANGTGTACPSAAAPCAMHQNVRYIRPMFLVNHSGGNGIADIDYIKVTKM